MGIESCVVERAVEDVAVQELPRQDEDVVAADDVETAGSVPAGDVLQPAGGNVDWGEAIGRDARVGYILSDLLAGRSLDESVRQHLGAAIGTDSPDPESIAAAEERGYLRARNEMAERELSRPGLWQDYGVDAADEGQSGFLSRVRPSVWD